MKKTWITIIPKLKTSKINNKNILNGHICKAKCYCDTKYSNRTVNPLPHLPLFQLRATRIILRTINLRGINIYYRWITINCRGTCAQTVKLSRIMVIFGGGPDTSKIVFCQNRISGSETGLKTQDIARWRGNWAPQGSQGIPIPNSIYFFE